MLSASSNEANLSGIDEWAPCKGQQQQTSAATEQTSAATEQTSPSCEKRENPLCPYLNAAQYVYEFDYTTM